MRHGRSLIGTMTLGIAVLVCVAAETAAQIHWQIDAASICGNRHSYRFYQRYSSTFSLDVAGPNDAIEVAEAAFNPATGRASSQSVWRAPNGDTLKKLSMAATCKADPWLFPQATAKCSNFAVEVSCPSGSCPGADTSPKFRVPAGVVKAKPPAAEQLPPPVITSPQVNHSYMVLEVPVSATAAFAASSPYCAVMEVKATQGAQVVNAVPPLTAGSAKDTLSFVGKPLGQWTLTAKIRQYTGTAAEWSQGPTASVLFYVGPAWPGQTEKPVSATMIQIVSPAAASSIAPSGSSLTIRVHRDLLAAATPKQAALNWTYAASGGGLPGQPWPGSTPLPPTLALPSLPLRGDPEWRQYSVPLDFGSVAVHKQWTLRVCVRAYDTDLCQQSAFTLSGS